MVRKYYSVVLYALALLFAGCSSHPPSAAQFMNVRKEDGKFNNSFIVGASLRTGDIYKEHVDGEVIQWDSYTGAESYGNLDLSLLFGFSHFVAGGSFENVSFKYIMGFRSRYIGLQGWGGIVPKTFFPDVNPFFGGLMLIEEYPILGDFKIGLSEHISRNAYHVHYDLKDISSLLYSEFGFGTYLTYKDFSIEFRYGREFDEPRNRFYFMTHYAFFNE